VADSLDEPEQVHLPDPPAVQRGRHRTTARPSVGHHIHGASPLLLTLSWMSKEAAPAWLNRGFLPPVRRRTGGTLGIGPEGGYRFSKAVGVRANATFLSISRGFDRDEVDRDGEVKLKPGGAMMALFPSEGGFFVSGGARINGNKGRAVATPAGPQEIGDRVYTPAQIGTLRGRAETKNFAPQLTLG
jgi:hypothetical protein